MNVKRGEERDTRIKFRNWKNRLPVNEIKKMEHIANVYWVC